MTRRTFNGTSMCPRWNNYKETCLPYRSTGEEFNHRMDRTKIPYQSERILNDRHHENRLEISAIVNIKRNRLQNRETFRAP